MNFAKTWVFVSTEAATVTQATDLEATFRSGQTFLTWTENLAIEGESYRIYRHSEPIDAFTLEQADAIAQVDDQSSYHAYENPGDSNSPIGQQNFIIEDKTERDIEGIGTELGDDTGLFVYTNHEPNDLEVYYAVTTVDAEGNENRTDFTSNALGSPITEREETPRPIHIATQNDGTSRIGYAYTLFMDYNEWNPKYKGYAYNFTVNLPEPYDFDGTREYPIILHIEGWGSRYRYDEFNTESFLLRADDAMKVWYFGFGASHDGSQFQSGFVGSYHEKYLVEAVLSVLADPDLRADEDRVFAYGHSMGGSGSLTLGMRYPTLFAAVYASQPITDYATSDFWLSDVEPKWGSSANGGEPIITLPTSDSRHNDITRYNGVPVFDWQNAQLNLETRSADDMAYIQTGHATGDTTVDWVTQGDPWYALLEGSGHWLQWNGHVDDGGCHCWMGFRGMNIEMMTDGGAGEWEEWQLKNDEPRPALADAQWEEIGELTWSASYYDDEPADTVDSPSRFEITLRSGAATFTADVTPRQLQQFEVAPSSSYDWRNEQDGAVIASGVAVSDAQGQITIEQFEISSAGNRLVIESEAAPIEPTVSITMDRTTYSQTADVAEVTVELVPGDTEQRVDLRIDLEYEGREPVAIVERPDFLLDTALAFIQADRTLVALPLGTHQWVATLRDPATGEFIGEPSTFTFTVEP